METQTLIIIIAIVAAVVASVLIFVIINSRTKVLLAQKDGRIGVLESTVKEREKDLCELQENCAASLRDLRQSNETVLSDLKASHKAELENLNKMHQEQLMQVVAQVRNELKLEYEESLKAGKEELSNGNKSDMESILNPLKESIEGMRKAMKDNADEHLQSTTELKTKLEQAVKDMGARTADIGAKADSLSEALSGRPKMQGNWGENMLDSILAQEGLIKGMHYTREDAREDLSRPDFIFHFREGEERKDLIVDSKVSLTAFVRYMNASTDDERKEALSDHLKSITSHINELTKKEYAKKVDRSRMFTDQVVMFMPIDQAFRTALDANPMLWQEAYAKGVLIATEQTIMPFLKILQLTWNKYQQDTNLQEIKDAAENMIERVGLFYESYKELGKKLKVACAAYNDGIVKLEDNGKSITTAARRVMKFGVKRPRGKEFSVPEESILLGEEIGE